MDRYLVVGDADCPFNKVVLEMGRSATGGQLVSGWSKLAMVLDLPNLQRCTLEADEKRGVRNLDSLLIKLLESWRARRGQEATLITLVRHLCSIPLNDIAVHLWTQFPTQIPDSARWEDLPPFVQETIKKTCQVMYFNKQKSFEDFLQVLPTSEDRQNLLNEMDGSVIRHMINNNQVKLKYSLKT